MVVIDGRVHFDGLVGLADADDADTALLLEQLEVDPGTHPVRITLYDDPESQQVLFDDTVTVQAGERLVLDYRDIPVAVPAEAGRALFNETVLGSSAGCRICHSLDPGRTLVGPSLAGLRPGQPPPCPV